MEIPKTYEPSACEDKWYRFWNENGFFRSVPDDREPFTIVMPPPNVTGQLHMGHMLNHTIQDLLIRRARMQGKNACWVPGTDHASIATEAKVVALLKERGINKQDISREKFLEYAWEWKEKYGGIILDQLQKLGASCDWERTRFTLEESLSDAVLDVFVDLYKKGLIYRGVRMVNWDPAGMTALSDEEVVHKEVDSKLYFVKYKIEGSNDEWITVATTRPETILGDTGVCVHPNDPRYSSLKGKRAIIPIVNRSVPIIFDDYIDIEFGTGALKVTPAHDINDYNLGIKHNLEAIDTIASNGTMSEAAQFYIGKDRFVVRDEIVKDLARLGQVVKTEAIKNKVGYSQRTDAVIEPKLSLQWFVKMDGLAKPALDHVMNDDVRLIPDKYKNTYRHWMENVHDWCISRQLWWGQRIPAWYCSCAECHDVVMVQKDRPAKCVKCGCEKEVYQDEDVVDTWFSSWLWPISVFDGFKNPKNTDIQYYYPTNVLVTGWDIIFFWVARMVMAGYEYRNEKPFSEVYFTGMVRDKQGRKMSKQLGNSPDMLGLISKFSADGTRFGVLISSPAGNDLLFDEMLCEQGRNFANKIWNAFRLINGWDIMVKEEYGDLVSWHLGITYIPVDKNSPEQIAMNWFDSKLNSELEIINDHYNNFRISEGLMSTYKLIWDDFCSRYLEMVKPEFGKTIHPDVFEKSVEYFESLLKILHPVMPFITEEIWHLLKDRSDKDCIIVASEPKGGKYNKELLSSFEISSEIIAGIRNIRKEKNISYKEALALQVRVKEENFDHTFDPILKKMCNISHLIFSEEKPDNALTFRVNLFEFFIPFTAGINIEKEIEKLQKDLIYNEGFLTSVQKKLTNEKFVNNAKPEVLEMERKKQSDAEVKIKMIREQITQLTINN